MTVNAFCKINLTLEILGTKRNDGYHDILTIMKKLPFGDKITVTANDYGTISLKCDKNLCDEKSNLAYLAAHSFLSLYNKKCGDNKGADITLIKNTPTGAGLGGGSSDAAAVLDALQKMLGEVSDDEISSLAEKLGSDVPFCLERYNLALCYGRGEKVRELTARLPRMFVLVAKPKKGLETKGIYREYDSLFCEDYSKNKSLKLEEMLEKGCTIHQLGEILVNDFERLCVARLPEIGEIKNAMYSCGAAVSQMSGSGSAVFGMFEKKDAAAECEKKLKSDGVLESFICEID